MPDKIIQAISLFCCEGSSDKVYHMQLVEVDGGYNVAFQYGRRGSALTSGVKNKAPVAIEAAQKIYQGLFKEKTTKTPPYKIGPGPGQGSVSTPQNVVGFVTPVQAPADDPDTFVPHLLMPVDDAEQYLKNDNYLSQEKKDGVHHTIKKVGDKVTVRNKKGKSIPFSKGLETIVEGISHDFHIDVETIGDTYHAFDVMMLDGKDLKSLGYMERFKALQGLLTGVGPEIVLVPIYEGYEAKKVFYERLKKEGKEGIVFKHAGASYMSGARDERMAKVKFYATLSARVAKGREGKRSIGLELLDDKGNWVFMGNCTIPNNKITVPSVHQIVEIKYLYAYKNGCLYQPSFKEPRDDVDESECLMSQVKYKAEED